MQFQRSSGILMPVFSLPSPHGIGTLGKSALDFIDFVKKAGQKYWQMLPLTPSGSGESPYSSYSVFAGNPFFIDLDLLVEDGMLTKEDVDAICWENDPNHIDYSIFHENHEALLRKAYARTDEKMQEKMREFCSRYGAWVENYALYMALKKHFQGAVWTEWEDRAIRKHEAEAVRIYREKLAEDVGYYIFEQYLFYTQWETVREYARKQEIGLIGDIPMFVALDSADVWAEPQFFQLDEENIPTFVAGVPPDYFSEDGQLWGNPLYDWKVMENDGFGWWIRRIDQASKLYDVLRIDHFRGLASYWAVPYGSETAKTGHWVPAPGIKLMNVLMSWFSNTKFIAEDLGTLSQDVYDLLNATKLPGMKVLEFAFDPVTPSSYLPHYFPENCVCYTGTHDNATAAGWMKDGNIKEVEHAMKYVGILPFGKAGEEAADDCEAETGTDACTADAEAVETAEGAEATAAETEAAETADAEEAADEEIVEKAAPEHREYSPEEVHNFTRALLRAGMSSVASLFVAQIQDYLDLDNSSRINIPGTAEGNWNWKLSEGMLTDALAEEIAAMTKMYGR